MSLSASSGKRRALRRDTRGASTVEYALIVALIVIVVVVAIVQLGQTTSDMWSNVSTKVQRAS